MAAAKVKTLMMHRVEQKKIVLKDLVPCLFRQQGNAGTENRKQLSSGKKI